MNPESLDAQDLGDADFCRDYGLKYAYLAGAMYKAIASVELVSALGKAGLMGYYGTGGVDFQQVTAALERIQAELANGGAYGVNVLSNLERPDEEARLIDLLLARRVTRVEAAAFMQVTLPLVWFRLKGIRRDAQGRVMAPNRVLAKISRPEVATAFMEPAPPQLVRQLVETRRLTEAEAQLAAAVPMAQEICVEADSGGHTNQGVAYALMPVMLRLRAEAMAKFSYDSRIRIGAAGGLGTPDAVAAAFVLGADFVVTGSVNQCTVEAGTSEAVKDLLETMDVQDTAYAPAGDMFELGAKVQVLRKGMFFPARANKLYELYMRHASLEEIPAKTLQQIEEKFFRRSCDEVWRETRAYLQRTAPAAIDALERNPKQKMASIFKWYFVQSTRLALQGVHDRKVDFQVQCGPALGAFNKWAQGTPLERWRQRGVAQIAEALMTGAAQVLNERYGRFARTRSRRRGQPAAELAT